MKLWSDLRALLFPAPPPPPSDAPSPPETVPVASRIEEPAQAPPSDPVVADSPDLGARRQRAAERLLEDERLRRDVTDEEFQPLLDWALTAIDRVVVDGSDQDVDAATEQIRTVIQAIGDALVNAPDLAQEEFAAQLRVALEGLEPPLVPSSVVEGGRQVALTEMQQIAGRKDELSGPEIAGRIARSLGTVTAGQREANS